MICAGRRSFRRHYGLWMIDLAADALRMPKNHEQGRDPLDIMVDVVRAVFDDVWLETIGIVLLFYVENWRKHTGCYV